MSLPGSTPTASSSVGLATPPGDASGAPHLIINKHEHHYKNYSELGKYLRYALAGAQCACYTHLILVPVDVVKTRLQIQQTKQYTGMFDAFAKIPKQEGVSALLLGATPTAVGYLLQGACKFAFYEFFKNKIAGVLDPATAARNTLPIYLTASALAETIGSICLCPWEAVRIRMVAAPDTYARIGTIGALSKIIREEGFYGGLYRGLGPILAKQLPYTMTQLTVFTAATDVVYNTLLPRLSGNTVRKDDLSTGVQLSISVGCGVIAGVTSSLASHPADTVLSRINMKKKASAASGESLSTLSNWQLTKQIVKELGFRGLWLGTGARCAMVGTLSAGMFLIYDSVKVMCGLPTTSGIKTSAAQK